MKLGEYARSTAEGRLKLSSCTRKSSFGVPVFQNAAAYRTLHRSSGRSRAQV